MLSVYVNQTRRRYPGSRKTLLRLTTAGLGMAMINCTQLASLYGPLLRMPVPSGSAVGSCPPTGLAFLSRMCICVSWRSMGVRSLNFTHFASHICLGMPYQFSTDCGSETTQVFAFGTALRRVGTIFFRCF